MKWFRTLIDRNNNFDDDFHFDLFTPFVIGRGIDAKRDIVHINITSMWFLLNILRAIACGWVFQLNADTTFSESFCRAAVDMIGFGVNSVGNQCQPQSPFVLVTHSASHRERDHVHRHIPRTAGGCLAGQRYSYMRPGRL